MADSRPHFLFLQGAASPFFTRLADHLARRGSAVSRINFSAGDQLYWGRRPARVFRGRLVDLPDFLHAVIAGDTASDLVLFGDHRPIHRMAIDLAQAAGIRVHVFEEGYFRPNWLTLERGGVNGASSLPRDPDWYRLVAPTLDALAPERPVPRSLRVRAAHDLAYHLANIANPVLFRGYRTHRPYNAAVEYAGWIRRFSTLPLDQRRDHALIRRLLRDGTRYFLLPLQLNGDTQITAHSPFTGMPALIEHVVRSFAKKAPGGSVLVVKNHPLDTGLFHYRGLVARLGRELELKDRLIYIESGDIAGLIGAAAGMVTVNSTAGLQALAMGCPTLALGTAIYDMRGLTSPTTLDAFWHAPQPPDPVLFDAFRKVVIHTTQVNGDLYTASGIATAMANCERLMAAESPLQRLKALYGAGSAAPGCSGARG
jgi:capsular polysaccharide export protein